MSTDKDKQARQDQATPDKEAQEGQSSSPAEKTTPAEVAAQQAKKPYVFKFAPADPKNTLNFEDMADK